MRSRFGRKCLFPFLFTVLALLMTFTASAASDHSGWKQVNKLADLSGQFSSDGRELVKPGNYYLNDNVVTDNCFVVDSGQVKICLHGHKIETKGSNFTFIVRGGASLILETCGNGEGKVVNSNNTVAAVAIYVAANSTLHAGGGDIICEKGNAIRLNTGTVTLQGHKVSGERSGVGIEAGTLVVRGSEVWGMTKYGVSVDQQNASNIDIRLVEGMITGLDGGIVSGTSCAGKVRAAIDGGDVAASISINDCIRLNGSDCSLTITDGSFFGKIGTGMKGTVTGGRYTDDSVALYVPGNYICRRTSDSDFRYEVGLRRTYTVTFTNGLGEVLKTQYVKEGYNASAPSDPTREGYIFDGWDKSFTNLSGTETSVIVNAKWKLKTTEDLKKMKGLKLKSAKTSIRVSWNRPSKKALKKMEAIEIQYASMKDFSDAKTILVKKKRTRAVLKGLSRKTKYYVRIRARRSGSDTTHVSKWASRSIRTK